MELEILKKIFNSQSGADEKAGDVVFPDSVSGPTVLQ